MSLISKNRETPRTVTKLKSRKTIMCQEKRELFRLATSKIEETGTTFSIWVDYSTASKIEAMGPVIHLEWMEEPTSQDRQIFEEKWERNLLIMTLPSMVADSPSD